MKSPVRFAVVALCAAALSLSLFGCSTAQRENEPASTSAVVAKQDRTIVDMKGSEVTVPAEASTILTANSVATQMVLMLGGEEAAASLGQGFNYDDGGLNKAMFPNLGDTRTFKRDDVTVENVAAVNPGIVVVDVEDTVSKLRDAGIPAAYMAVTSPETIMQAMTMIGDSLGGQASEKAKAYASAYQAAIDDASSRVADTATEDKPSVLYLRSTEKTAGSGSMPDNWITTAGGINSAAQMGISGSGADVNIESVLNMNPDIIVCESEKVRDEVLASAGYAETNAVKNEKVYAAPFGTAVWSMGTAEAMLQVYWAGSIISPDKFADVDVDQITRDFYRDYYEYDLSDDQLDVIFHR